MKTIKVKYGGFETEQCVDDALYDAIYEKGKADAKRESNEFFNFEGARELCEKRIRAEERKDVIEMIKLELHPCMECPSQDECNCDEQFDDCCRSERSISFDDVLSALHKLEKKEKKE